MAIQEHTKNDHAERMELTRMANHEISKLADAVSDICKDEDQPVYHGIMARIKTLSEIIYFAQKLHGEDEGDEPTLQDLQRVYTGYLS